jgi:hypothetical protein
MNPTDPYETGFPKKGTYEKIPYRDSVGNLGFRHLSLGSREAKRGEGGWEEVRRGEGRGENISWAPLTWQRFCKHFNEREERRERKREK